VIDQAVRQRTVRFATQGIPSPDALHVACAEVALAD